VSFQKLERELILKGYKNILGVDEVGRGPAAGPMVFAGVLYDEKLEELVGLNDSKKLSESMRETIFKEIICGDFKFGLGVVWPEEIDNFGLSKCSKIAIERICDSINVFFGVDVDYFLMDGNLKVPDKFLFVANESIVKGDSKSVSIAAASVLAKVFRDQMMKQYSVGSPFSFDRHKAYLTKLHKDEIKEYGLARIHRKSYKIKI
jgi:ribonuclease HII